MLFLEITATIVVTIHTNVVFKAFATPVVSAISAYTLVITRLVVCELICHGSSREERFDFDPKQVATSKNSDIN